MQANATFSTLSYTDCAEYLRLTEVSQSDIGTLNQLLAIGRDYIKHFTGRTENELDGCNDINIVLMILVQDMWDNRTLYVDSENLNKVVESILNLHSVNLL